MEKVREVWNMDFDVFLYLNRPIILGVAWG